ncbi:hypothetical protein VP01_2195g1 [Puccinia sorghi]|uniref:Uncharacterized protein n=1 Tax=Puccinia sorghi TaxID=27349 RepID=A0A0L6V905_9BASI|nr:hypothetical protein VP01_2195g1 [Puccinia sorghi]
MHMHILVEFFLLRHTNSRVELLKFSEKVSYPWASLKFEVQVQQPIVYPNIHLLSFFFSYLEQFRIAHIQLHYAWKKIFVKCQCGGIYFKLTLQPILLQKVGRKKIATLMIIKHVSQWPTVSTSLGHFLYKTVHTLCFRGGSLLIWIEELRLLAWRARDSFLQLYNKVKATKEHTTFFVFTVVLIFCTTLSRKAISFGHFRTLFSCQIFLTWMFLYCIHCYTKIRVFDIHAELSDNKLISQCRMIDLLNQSGSMFLMICCLNHTPLHCWEMILNWFRIYFLFILWVPFVKQGHAGDHFGFRHKIIKVFHIKSSCRDLSQSTIHKTLLIIPCQKTDTCCVWVVSCAQLLSSEIQLQLFCNLVETCHYVMLKVYQTLHQDKKKPLAMMESQCIEAVSLPCHQTVQLYVMVTRCQLQAEGFPLFHLRKRKGLGESGSGSGSSSKEEKNRIDLQRIFEIQPPPTHPFIYFLQLSHWSNVMNFTVRLVDIQASELNQAVVFVLLSFCDWGCQDLLSLLMLNGALLTSKTFIHILNVIITVMIL